MHFLTAGSMLLTAIPVCFCPLCVCECARACVCLNILTDMCIWPVMLLLSLHCYLVCTCQAIQESCLTPHHEQVFHCFCQEVFVQAVLCCEINCLWACMASLGVHKQSQLSGGRNAATGCKSCACFAGELGKPYKRVIMFVDNAGADILLGMLPLARCFTWHSYSTFT